MGYPKKRKRKKFRHRKRQSRLTRQMYTNKKQNFIASPKAVRDKHGRIKQTDNAAIET